MNAKLVVPLKISVAPVLSFVRMRAEEAGAWMSDRVTVRQADTAGEIWE